MNKPTFKSGSSGRNPLLDPVLLVPVMALTLGLVAAWRYWDDPNVFSGGGGDSQNGFEDLLTEFEESQRSPEALAADIDSSQVLSGELRSLGGVQGNRDRDRNRNKENNEPKAKSSDDILKLLNNVSRSPTGGGSQAAPAASIFNSDRSTSIGLGQFQADGSFRGRGLSLAPSEQELARNAALGRFQSLQQGQANSDSAQDRSESPLYPRRGGFDGGVPANGVPGGVVGRSSTVPPAAVAPGYGTARPVPGAVGTPGATPNYGSAPVGQPRTYTSPGYGVSPTVPSVAGSGPLVPATSGPGYSRGLRNYQLNTAPAPNTGFSNGTGGVGGNRPLRSQNGAGALEQPQPAPSSNIGGRSFGSFSNPYRR
ncbi:MAG: hypothetical protein ACFCBU_01595 [Cyanophyceae cyanobacterium]